MTQFIKKMHTIEDTNSFGQKLAELLQPGDIITMEGDLGAGKTTLTKAIGAGLGVKRTINSPTFTIIKEYEGRLPLYHMDVYRLENSDEDIGFEEYFSGEGVSIVEWAQFIEDYLPKERLELTLKHDGEARTILLQPIGERYEKLCKELAE
ncbi:tRNA (adenosine(37)-N6)-threonylcarbamoyltransferase complex ATPase subunit type 1 TsaE [Terribacillus saccharophilus]|uniref:tRNA threonylcarbamoyladenosine biosynthesis protein TsaE n=1 Tax=Terribacillus saccharophilus TaxID=361277 RepID=A0A268H9B6_9BACI|nr:MULTISPECIES: tRNA (adenosine(37)-N6)-threonylcarbamoyltransferase complex ATPase subunit type 1 TsaE [Terribacillus]PAD35880.1 tRNA (adenosine(37)-N6)-threonylcarbamoyltransferase complex ATPase subunit type 1 TsaE [Terribacillus saccharophilus]PAD96253.1 tRNA (adenosine(37)-N6)-threonylcarbamoyltransferase complex ATPase subunit type 1 TsaE [Terribacillus saccharophilus]PAD99829.1 tRNA (adenosine(37)-N6)-threonylcarbamoyltransferase complex ATPase subunit type 1 TsaE [Terribacillus saccharo